jgi:hypothetical protein
MERLNYNQILEQLKNSGIEISEFAWNDTPFFQIDGEFSEKATEAKQIHHQWLKDNPQPAYNSKKYDEWKKKYDLIPTGYDVARQEWLEQNTLPSWEEVDQVGGEDEGSHWHSVKYFKDHDVYIKVTGWYSSYNGTDFEDWDEACSEVRPQEKVITVWE